MVAYSFKKRFVQPIEIGLKHAHHILDGVPGLVHPKRQTIRAFGKRRHARPGEALQLYCGMRSRACFKIGDAICLTRERVIVWTGEMTIMVNGKLLGPRQAKAFALADGFESLDDMREFWRTEHKGVDKFEGYLIQWEPIHG